MGGLPTGGEESDASVPEVCDNESDKAAIESQSFDVFLSPEARPPLRQKSVTTNLTRQHSNHKVLTICLPSARPPGRSAH